MENKKNICVIGSGFAGISAATYLSDKGHKVYVLEKNSKVGEELENLLQKDLLLIWDHLGIGCLMFLKNFFLILIKI